MRLEHKISPGRTFKVIGINPLDGDDSFPRKSGAEALQKAKVLADQGYKDVRIIDPQGRKYTPADFDRLYFSSTKQLGEE